MSDIEPLFNPPYTAVIFTSLRTDGDNGYTAMAKRMSVLASQQPGYLGQESARGEDCVGITVSYWQDAEAARNWKRVSEHLAAQEFGQQQWYRSYRVRIATVEREYGF